MSDGVVKVKGCQPYGSLATEGFNQPCNMGEEKKKGAATPTQMSVTNVKLERSRGWIAVGEERED